MLGRLFVGLSSSGARFCLYSCCCPACCSFVDASCDRPVSLVFGISAFLFFVASSCWVMFLRPVLFVVLVFSRGWRFLRLRVAVCVFALDVVPLSDWLSLAVSSGLRCSLLHRGMFTSWLVVMLLPRCFVRRRFLVSCCCFSVWVAFDPTLVGFVFAFQ